MYLSERNIYGSERVGMEKIGEIIASSNVLNVNINTDIAMITGDKFFEMSNHLGNVLQVVTDNKLPEPDGQNGVDHYVADVVSYSDYYPFGMQMPGRNGSTGEYRYGFQGQEKDDEVKGEGNSINYKYRMHDPRVGRFFAVDPLAHEFPHNSPYAFSENRVIDGLEFEGLEVVLFQDGKSWTETVDFSNMTDSEIESKLAEVYEYHQGIITLESIKSANKDSYWKVENLTTFYGHSYGTRVSGYGNDSKRKNVQSEKTFQDWSQWYFSFGDGDAWEGNADPTNSGGKYGGEHGWNNGGSDLFFGTIGVITAPFTIAGGGIYAVAGSVGLANSADDIAGAATHANGKSLLENLTKDTNYGQLTSNLKAGATFVTSIGGGAQLWKMGADVDAPTLIGTANDIGTLVDTYLENANESKVKSGDGG